MEDNPCSSIETKPFFHTCCPNKFKAKQDPIWAIVPCKRAYQRKNIPAQQYQINSRCKSQMAKQCQIQLIYRRDNVNFWIATKLSACTYLGTL